MARGFIKGNINQMYLLPPSIDDWISKKHPIRFIKTCLEQMNLMPFYKPYAKEGRPPYDPNMMLCILIYSYSKGMRSSRKISNACEDEIPLRWITGNIIPNHRAICRFRIRHEKQFKEIFYEVLRLCHESGLLNLGNIFLDGTKIKANAALSSNYTLDYINKILEEAKTADKAEDEKFGESQGGDCLPKELINSEERIKRIKAAKERLDCELKKKQEQQTQKIKKYKESISKKVCPTRLSNELKIYKKANIIDPESRIMKNRSGFVQGYNCQAVCTENQIIISADVSQQENDFYQLEPMLKQTITNLQKLGNEKNLKTLSADAGFFRENLDIKNIEKNGPKLLLCTKNSYKLRKEIGKIISLEDKIPKKNTNKSLMDMRLLTHKWYNIYKKRSYTIEPVFGQIKNCLNLNKFLRRGLKAVKSEWLFACSISNLMKLFRSKVLV